MKRLLRKVLSDMVSLSVILLAITLLFVAAGLPVLKAHRSPLTLAWVIVTGAFFLATYAIGGYTVSYYVSYWRRHDGLRLFGIPIIRPRNKTV